MRRDVLASSLYWNNSIPGKRQRAGRRQVDEGIEKECGKRTNENEERKKS